MSNQERSGTMTRIADDTHARIHDHNRDGETLSGTIGRALDALEQDKQLPKSIAEELLTLSETPPKVLVIRDGDLTAEDAEHLINELEEVLTDE